MTCPFCQSINVQLNTEEAAEAKYMAMWFICDKGHVFFELREKTYIELMQDIHDEGAALFRELIEPFVPLVDWIERKLRA